MFNKLSYNEYVRVLYFKEKLFKNMKIRAIVSRLGNDWRSVPLLLFTHMTGFERIVAEDISISIKKLEELYSENDVIIECSTSDCNNYPNVRISIKVLSDTDLETIDEYFDQFYNTDEELIICHIPVCTDCERSLRNGNSVPSSNSRALKPKKSKKIIVKDETLCISKFFYEAIDCKVCGGEIAINHDNKSMSSCRSCGELIKDEQFGLS